MKVALTPHQRKFIDQKMKSGGYLSRSEVVREAIRVYELHEQDDNDPELESALLHALRSPGKKYKRDHFSALGSKRLGSER